MEKNIQENVYKYICVCVCVTESLCSIVEINTTLSPQLYFSKKQAKTSLQSLCSFKLAKFKKMTYIICSVSVLFFSEGRIG